MIFNKKKPGTDQGSGQAVMRGRENAAGGNRENPLARRFHPDDEPDTIDLEDPGRFHSAIEDADPPTTQYLEAAEEQVTAGDGHSIVTLDPQSGKFFIHPGEGETQVLLGGEPVLTPTELRPGDQISIGQARFQFT